MVANVNTAAAAERVAAAAAEVFSEWGDVTFENGRWVVRFPVWHADGVTFPAVAYYALDEEGTTFGVGFKPLVG